MNRLISKRVKELTHLFLAIAYLAALLLGGSYLLSVLCVWVAEVIISFIVPGFDPNAWIWGFAATPVLWLVASRKDYTLFSRKS